MQLLGWLVPLQGPQQGRAVHAAAEHDRSAPTPECNDRACNDKFMSSKHAEIKAENGMWILRDTGSTNGTYVNNRRVDSHELVDNDFIKFGSAMCKFKSAMKRAAHYCPVRRDVRPVRARRPRARTSGSVEVYLAGQGRRSERSRRQRGKAPQIEATVDRRRRRPRSTSSRSTTDARSQKVDDQGRRAARLHRGHRDDRDRARDASARRSGSATTTAPRGRPDRAVRRACSRPRAGARRACSSATRGPPGSQGRAHLVHRQGAEIKVPMGAARRTSPAARSARRRTTTARSAPRWSRASTLGIAELSTGRDAARKALIVDRRRQRHEPRRREGASSRSSRSRRERRITSRRSRSSTRRAVVERRQRHHRR